MQKTANKMQPSNKINYVTKLLLDNKIEAKMQSKQSHNKESHNKVSDP